jgi:LuxR family maltose regulon positive regulatory protein
LAVIGLGWLLLERNDLEGAARRLKEGVELTNRWSDVASLQGYIGLALVKQAQGDTASADHVIQTARQLAARLDATEMDDILVEAYQARLWIAQGSDDPGRLARVLAWLEKRGLDTETALDELKQETGNVFLPLVRAFEYIPLARLHLAQGQLDDALALLDPLLQKVEGAGWMWLGIEVLTLQAVAYQHRGDTTQALAALERALSLAKSEGLVRLFLDSGPPMGELLQQAAARGIAVDYAGKLLAFFAGKEQSLPESSSTPASMLAEPLSQREFEVLELIAAGLSNREIAEQLVVAISTVKTHLNNIYGKLNVSSRTQAVARARVLKLI